MSKARALGPVRGKDQTSPPPTTMHNPGTLRFHSTCECTGGAVCAQMQLVLSLLAANMPRLARLRVSLSLNMELIGGV
jgi:hypothetical protein